jgi:hypothetical protein
VQPPGKVRPREFPKGGPPLGSTLPVRALLYFRDTWAEQMVRRIGSETYVSDRRSDAIHAGIR